MVLDSKTSSIIHIYATPGYDTIKLYLSSEEMYPNQEHFQWNTSGYKHTDLQGSGVELSPFIINEKNMLEYVSSTDMLRAKTLNNETIGYKIDTCNWRLHKNNCFISVYNSTEMPVLMSLTLTGK